MALQICTATFHSLWDLYDMTYNVLQSQLFANNKAKGYPIYLDPVSD